MYLHILRVFSRLCQTCSQTVHSSSFLSVSLLGRCFTSQRSNCLCSVASPCVSCCNHSTGRVNMGQGNEGCVGTGVGYLSLLAGLLSTLEMKCMKEVLLAVCESHQFRQNEDFESSYFFKKFLLRNESTHQRKPLSVQSWRHLDKFFRIGEQ